MRGTHVGLMAGIVLAAAALDQVTKAMITHSLAPGEAVAVLGDWARLYLVFNPGAAFSLGSGSTWLFTCIQLAFVVGISWYSPKVTQRGQAIGLAMIAGGALGNLIDRLFREPAFFIGHVVDFISIGNFAIFNVADSFITCGVVVFVGALLFEEAR